MSDWFPKSHECPACGSQEIRSEFQMVYWRDYPLDFHHCFSCDARFANPMPGNALIAKGNDALVRYYQRDRDFQSEFRDARQAYLRGKLLAHRLKRWKTSGRLLEVGCFRGFFLAGIRDNCDWQVEGVEIAASLVRFARDKLGLTMHHGVLEEAVLPESSYDFIVCNDLIEHITQPRHFLAEVARLLAPNGRIQLITPNAIQDTAFARRASASGKPLQIVLNHIMFYSPTSLRRALERSGLSVRKLYGFDITHAFKDFGVLGMGKVGAIEPGPRFGDVTQDLVRDFSAEWTPARLRELKEHPKTSYWYGLWREEIPRLFTLPVPESVGIGHEIYALAERP